MSQSCIDKVQVGDEVLVLWKNQYNYNGVFILTVIQNDPGCTPIVGTNKAEYMLTQYSSGLSINKSKFKYFSLLTTQWFTIKKIKKNVSIQS